MFIFLETHFAYRPQKVAKKMYSTRSANTKKESHNPRPLHQRQHIGNIRIWGYRYSPLFGPPFNYYFGSSLHLYYFSDSFFLHSTSSILIPFCFSRIYYELNFLKFAQFHISTLCSYPTNDSLFTFQTIILIVKWNCISVVVKLKVLTLNKPGQSHNIQQNGYD